MKKDIDSMLTKAFFETGDPFYYTARGILRERSAHGGSGKNSGNSSEKG
ncbi:MAG: hypothetical protein IKB86_06220 [Clostridia bacterium]|nr:hypothetical protein [Clostridia bacterium]